jgi:hypothetical protein
VNHTIQKVARWIYRGAAYENEAKAIDAAEDYFVKHLRSLLQEQDLSLTQQVKIATAILEDRHRVALLLSYRVEDNDE